MKLKFKHQPYQAAAVQAVVDIFQGQPPASDAAMSYRLDPGNTKNGMGDLFAVDTGFKNAELTLSEVALLDNIQQVQRQQNLPLSESLVKTKVAKLNLDIEMETGTGKTYCYIKTVFELNKQYGWSKFVSSGAEHCHPRGRSQVVGNHGRALSGDLSQEGTLLYLQL